MRLEMGPNPLWLLEDLCGELDLRDGMRVLDLGSGRGATSVFLAREFGVDVVAVDLWVAPQEATAVFADAGVTGSVRAVQAEAHALPFPAGYFDAIVSVDAFEYFGTADSYLAYITRFLKPGGQLGVATPAMTREGWVWSPTCRPRVSRDSSSWSGSTPTLPAAPSTTSRTTTTGRSPGFRQRG